MDKKDRTIDRSALEYLHKSVVSYLVATGACEDGEGDEIYCENAACFYCTLAYAAERIRKIREGGVSECQSKRCSCSTSARVG